MNTPGMPILIALGEPDHRRIERRREHSFRDRSTIPPFPAMLTPLAR
jgi:hypothetical protein